MSESNTPEKNPAEPVAPERRPNLFVRVRNAVFCWRTARWLLIGLAGLLTLIAIVVTFEGIRGRKAWAKFKADMEAAGEPLDPMALRPAPVPDEQNFAMTPLLSPLLDYELTTTARGEEHVWKDAVAKKRLDEFKGLSDFPSELWGNRHLHRATDLGGWQAYLRPNTNFGVSIGEVSPAIQKSVDPNSGMSTVSYDTNLAAKEVLLALRKFDTEMGELHEAAKRPYAQFPVHYEEGFAAILPHLTLLRKFSRIARLKATAHLADNDPEQALSEGLLIVRFADAARAEPLLISGLVRIAFLEDFAEIVWEGMVHNRWKPSQLQQIEKTLSTVDCALDYQRAIRGERALALDSLLRMRKKIGTLMGGSSDSEAVNLIFSRGPDAIFYQNLVNIGRMYGEKGFPYVDVERRRFDLSGAKAAEKKIKSEMTKFHPYRVLAAVLFPAIGKAMQRSAHAQSEVDQIRIACGVEQYRIQHGKLPADLAALTPEYLEALPKDPVSGADYNYVVENGTSFAIYSFGADGGDDGGKVVFDKRDTNRLNYDEGDWVWRVKRAIGSP